MTRKTIEQALFAQGFGHRKMPNNRDCGVHEIYLVATGETVAHCDALSAYDRFCKPQKLEAALMQRDAFIVNRGLWGEFVESLPRTPSEWDT